MASLAMTVGLGGVTLATFAKLAVSPGESLDRFYTLMIKMNSLLTIPLFAFLLFNARGIVEMLYSSEYAGAILLVESMAAFRIASRIFAGSENAEYLLALGRVRTVVFVGIAAASLNIILNIGLIPAMGAAGSVVASGTANLVVNMLGAFMVSRISGARPDILFWAKVAGACCIVSWLSSTIIPDGMTAILIGGVAYCIVVLAVLSVVKPLSEIDSEWLSKIDRRLVSPLRWFTRARHGTEAI
jgi:O-antigen/teichoic acid export membrane protein